MKTRLTLILLVALFATLSCKAQDASLTFTVNGITFKMLPVAGGTFTMGVTSEQDSNADDDEKPTHSVTLSSYYMGETEVTQALWQAVMGSNPSCFKGNNLPVEQVSWNDCQQFITKLNRLLAGQLNGRQFALPTEAQWEYAARAGSTASLYNDENIIIRGKNNSPNLDKYAWYGGNCGQNYTGGSGYDISGWGEKQYDDKIGGTHPVGKKQPNAWGFYDMLGNVWEWCQDRYGSYGSSAQTDPTGPSQGSRRVSRGGSWNYNARDCRVSNRGGNFPDSTHYYLGLRLSLR